MLKCVYKILINGLILMITTMTIMGVDFHLIPRIPLMDPAYGLSVGFGAGYYSPYYGGFGYYSPLSYYNSYYAWNNFYNPYYGGVIIVNGKNNTTPSYTRMSNFNPTAYQGSYYNARPSTNFINNSGRNSTNSSSNNFNRSTNSRPSFNNSNYSPMRSSPSNFSSGGGGGGGASRGGGFLVQAGNS